MLQTEQKRPIQAFKIHVFIKPTLRLKTLVSYIPLKRLEVMPYKRSPSFKLIPVQYRFPQLPGALPGLAVAVPVSLYATGNYRKSILGDLLPGVPVEDEQPVLAFVDLHHLLPVPSRKV